MKTLSVILSIGGIDILLYTLTPSDGITQSATGISVALMYLAIMMIMSGVCMCLIQLSKKHHAENTITSPTITSDEPITQPMGETESIYSMRCIRILDYTTPKSIR